MILRPWGGGGKGCHEAYLAAISPCIPMVQELLATQPSFRGLLTSGVQSSGPAGPQGAPQRRLSRAGEPQKVSQYHLGMECQGVVKSWFWELPGPVTHFWGHSMQGGTWWQ